MAQDALSYTAGFSERCQGLTSGQIRGLLSETADNQSLTLMLTTGGNLFEGLENTLSTRYSAPTAEPLAQAIAKLWASL